MQFGDLFCNHTLHFCGIYLLIFQYFFKRSKWHRIYYRNKTNNALFNFDYSLLAKINLKPIIKGQAAQFPTYLKSSASIKKKNSVLSSAKFQLTQNGTLALSLGRCKVTTAVWSYSILWNLYRLPPFDSAPVLMPLQRSVPYMIGSSSLCSFMPAKMH